jgi:hypothetical protein
MTTLVRRPTPRRHRAATVRGMTASFVLHLQSGRLRDGEVCGVVEVVATGARRTVTSLEELRALLVAAALPPPHRDHDETGV